MVISRSNQPKALSRAVRGAWQRRAGSRKRREIAGRGTYRSEIVATSPSLAGWTRTEARPPSSLTPTLPRPCPPTSRPRPTRSRRSMPSAATDKLQDVTGVKRMRAQLTAGSKDAHEQELPEGHRRRDALRRRRDGHVCARVALRLRRGRAVLVDNGGHRGGGARDGFREPGGLPQQTIAKQITPYAFEGPRDARVGSRPFVARSMNCILAIAQMGAAAGSMSPTSDGCATSPARRSRCRSAC